MCGIAALWPQLLPPSQDQHDHNTSTTTTTTTFLHLKPLQPQLTLSPRGPDHYSETTIPLFPPNNNNQQSSSSRQLRLCASVLHIRGTKMTTQPIICPNTNNVLLYNGEIFGYNDNNDEIGDNNIRWNDDDHTRSDSSWLFDHLNSFKNTDEVIDFLNRLEGPWALAFWNHEEQRLYYGRDRLGRRSLLTFERRRRRRRWRRQSTMEEEEDDDDDDGGVLVEWGLSSVAFANDDNENDDDSTIKYTELQPLGLYSYSEHSTPSTHKLYPWPPPPPSYPPPSTPPYPPHLYPSTTPQMLQCASQLHMLLSDAVRRRVTHLPASSLDNNGKPRPTLGILFSGGLDSVVITALAHQHYEAHLPMELINVCFDVDTNFKSPDRRAALVSYKELKRLYPEREWRFVAVNVRYEEVMKESNRIKKCMEPLKSHMDFNVGGAFWFLARGRGFVMTTTTEESSSSCSFEESVVHLNSFLDGEQQNGKTKTKTKSKAEKLKCPMNKCKKVAKGDCYYGVCRKCCLLLQNGDISPPLQQPRPSSALSSSIERINNEEEEIKIMACPVHRPDTKTTTAATTTTTTTAIKETPSAITTPPTNNHSPTPPPPTYTAQSRILLLGTGSDEQLAGYSRHRTTYLTHGPIHLRLELTKDMSRLWTRNMGRDDRCLSSHSRESRCPFLDERVVSFLERQNVENLVDLSSTSRRGEGDKMILRLVGRSLGLDCCTHLAKRAIQFGTRLAKQTNRECGLSHRKARGVDEVEFQ